MRNDKANVPTKSIATCVILVLYRIVETESPGCLSLLKLVERLENEGSPLPALLLWDNTPDTAEHGTPQILTWPESMEVLRVHRPDNPGLVAAYNHALQFACHRNLQWLVTLDQDTVLPDNFLGASRGAMREADDEVAALAPIIAEANRHVSPIACIAGWPNAWNPVKKPGTQAKRIMAINSGLIVRRSFLDSIGGYSDDYQLDYVDHWLCREIYRRGKRMHIVNILLEHQLSVNDFTRRVTYERYASILNAQRVYLLSDEQWSTWLVAHLLLPLHALRMLFRTRDRRFFQLATREWFDFACRRR